MRMYMRLVNRSKFNVPTQEDLLERRIRRDNEVLARIRDGARMKAITREFGLSAHDVREIRQGERDRRAALKKAERLTRSARLRKEARDERAAQATWPPARIRNVLVREFGIPPDRVADAALIAETVTRSGILSIPMTHAKTADAVAAYLAGHGHALRD